VLYAPSMRNGFLARALEDRGNAILATTTLADATAIELPIEHQRRVALAATVHGTTTTGSAWTLRLADVHLDTALALLHGGPFTARRRQAQALVDVLGPTPTPTVVAGDFNTWRGSGESAVALLREAFPIGEQSSTTTWRGPLGLHASLDRVFARGVRSIDVRRLPERYGSDHYPLIADVTF
jgi:endonuclease/exonuclease/phosphatase family metal-dependent hydrolase